MGSGLSYDAISVPFFVFPILTYIAIAIVQYRMQQPETVRLQILSTRVALFLPVYALLIYIALVSGQAVYLVFQLPLAAFEAYSYYCFLVLLVKNFGGPRDVIQYMNQREGVFCGCCCPTDKLEVYKRVNWAMFHMIFTRTIVVAGQVACSLISYRQPNKAVTAIGAVLSLIATIFLLRGILSVVTIYENVYENAKNFDGVLKLLLLKVSIGVIVMQGLVEEFLVAYGNLNYNESTHQSDSFQALQVYGFIVLVELTALSFPIFYTYSKKITPFKGTLPAIESPPKPESPYSVCGFLCSLFNLNDIYGYLTYKEYASPAVNVVAV